MKRTYILIILLVTGMFLSSCKKEDSPAEPSEYGTISGLITDEENSTALPKVIIYTSPATSVVSTDAAGEYTISTVNPGEYVVTAVKVGYDSLVVGVTVEAAATSVADFILTPKDSSSNIKYGSIVGTIYNSETGETVSSVNLNTTPVTNSIRSDANGRFEFLSLEPGEYEITAEKNGFEPKSGSVLVRAGIESHSDIEITQIDTSTAEQKGTLTGKVINSVTDEPVVNVLVETSPSFGSVLTDSGGNYSLKNLPVGEYEVEVSKVNFSSVTNNLSIVGGKTTTANFSLTPSVGSVSGVVLDSLGSPLEFVEITTSPETSSFITNGEGKFGFENVPVGNLTVTANKQGYEAKSAEIVIEAGYETEVTLILNSL